MCQIQRKCLKILVTFGALTAMSVKTTVSCDVTSRLLADGKNVSEEPVAYIFFPEDKGSTMFRNTGTHIAV
jgi:hypothetical protein